MVQDLTYYNISLRSEILFQDSHRMAAVPLAYDVYNAEQSSLCPIILTHGLFWNKHMFKEIACALNQATKRKVYCLDLRNHGDSPCTDDCDISNMLEDIKYFVKDKQLGKVVFVSHSFSSTIAYLFLLDEPNSVEKIVMIDFPPFPDVSEAYRERNAYPQFYAQERILDTLGSRLTIEEARGKILHLSKSAPIGERYFLRKVAYDLVKIKKEFKWKTDHQYLFDLSKKDAFVVEPRGGSNHDILLIRGKDSDVVSDEKCAAVLKHNPNTKIVTIPDATHLLIFEKQEEFVEEVAKFLSQ